MIYLFFTFCVNFKLSANYREYIIFKIQIKWIKMTFLSNINNKWINSNNWLTSHRRNNSQISSKIVISFNKLNILLIRWTRIRCLICFRIWWMWWCKIAANCQNQKCLEWIINNLNNNHNNQFNNLIIKICKMK